ncbi:N-succinyl-5-aminoimidazole-4-carboxamide ribotide (SAICAR) synthetase [Komagataella phaffii CBS 7435]|uniref:Phosphoribosylaminoimidazole-succinocarboxamide synthase n=2 Tax=Komagataella phaffii TaxID=460519 RepID=C4QYH8_KOMPG|nr:N-succinyl-5-aminoimidazole-4-carboxamide ribotide (SAICAR) synthetase [Komagataella phaffii GS115]AOA61210.1 GQ67_01707T0 [Komagataella phaffii]KAI0464336.1 Bifunctional purine biosynthetic protein ade1 [Komagataella kurtzmanii]CAH2447124.1 N-succinyl-5-aminoimidazole-4-carboxamide ribotide (SAICAR) synthetase [Komagataella phaffii CBS 7435]AOA65370.1 GQ68_01722T0 [Komagataella phaffii GS115]CAY68301.1 N-succinyl-5-aminoimidazole-4-carboxamide ribotide (SAICAR) synthetase [Komagataella pha
MSIVNTDLDGILPLIAKGKVRDIYAVDENNLLFVATDRISAYDVIMTNGIPDKGKILTQLSVFWFDFLAPYIKNHLVASNDKEVFALLPSKLSEEKYKSQLEGRSLIVKKHRLIPLEAIVRGYITGSAWKEYKNSKTVHGVKVENENLQESDAFPTPIFTPSTKAEQGEHDENISIEQAAEIVGKDICEKVAVKAVELYSAAKNLALLKGIIIADTKFEFGLDENNELVLVDEVLTPDSSRFWNQKTYQVGKSQESYDKQFLRDWLTANGLNGKEGVAMDAEIAIKSKEKYIEAYEAITGKKWA